MARIFSARNNRVFFGPAQPAKCLGLEKMISGRKFKSGFAMLDLASRFTFSGKSLILASIQAWWRPEETDFLCVVRTETDFSVLVHKGVDSAHANNEGLVLAGNISHPPVVKAHCWRAT
jgi:hypothetical protein